MIRTLRFRNFKSLVDVDVEGLGPLTVFVGPNGSGKSSVLEGAHYLTQLGARPRTATETVLNRLGAIFQGTRSVARLSTLPERKGFDLSLVTDDGFELRLSATPGTSEEGDQFELCAKPGKHLPEEVVRTPPACLLSEFIDNPRIGNLASAVRLRLDARALARPSVATTSVPRVEHDGVGLPTVLSYLLQQRDSAIEAIEADLRRIVPQFRRVHTQPKEIVHVVKEFIRIDEQVIPRLQERTEPGFQLALEMAGGAKIPADLASEGTILALGLLTILHGPMRPRHVFLDDVDQALHPVAQAELVKAIRRILEATPDLQILCTSHSPYLLDHFEPEEIRVMRLDDQGRTVCRRLTDHPDWERWKGVMRSGEFWGSVGEGWITTPAPGQ